MKFVALEKLINLHDGYRRRIKIDSLEVLLLQEGNEIHIVEGRCPHQAYPLDNADVHDGVLYCPIHGYGFSLVDGAHDGGICASLKLYRPIFEGNEVGIALS